MSKKTNTIFFLLGATVFNIIVTIICFIIFLSIFARFQNHIQEETFAWLFPVIFIASIVASFFIYRGVMKIFEKKIDMEKYFDPLFGRRRPPHRKP